MKKYTLALSVLTLSLWSNAQYVQDAASLSQANTNGTARYRAMGGAFLALGGDLGAVRDNPAAASVFSTSRIGATLGIETNSNKSTLGGFSNNESESSLNFNNLGVIFTGNNFIGNTKWNHLSAAITYNKDKNFKNTEYYRPFETSNSGNTFINDGFISEQYGTKGVLGFDFAARYDDKLNIGVGLKSKSITNDISRAYVIYNPNSGQAELDNNNKDLYYYEGDGVSLNVGFIYKPIHSFRVAASYESPTWYSLYTPLTYDRFDSNGDFIETYSQEEKVRLNSPQKLRLGAAYVLGKIGLISGEAVYTDYSNIKWKPSTYFSTVNNSINNDLNSTWNYKLGGELRYKQMTFRGGYQYQKSPYKGEDAKADIQTLSAGLGYKIGHLRFDLSFDRSYNTFKNFLYEQNNNGVNTPIIGENNNKHTNVLFSVGADF